MKVYLTAKRKMLLSFLHEHKDEFLSAEDIYTSLGGISISAIYRNLSALTEQGVIRKSFAKDGNTALYQFCEQEKCHSHLHMKCNVCGRMQCVNKRNSDRIAELLSDDSFVIDEPGTVIYGKCKQCQNGKNKERLHDK